MTEFFDSLAPLAASTLRLAVPLIFGALAGIFSERAGVVDLGLEGKLLAGAFAAASAAAIGLPPWAALLVAMMVSLTLGLVHGWACITHRGDQIVSGIALNLIAAGATMVFALAWFNRSGRTPDVDQSQRFTAIAPEAAAAASGLPVVGPFLSQVVLGQDILALTAIAAAFGAWWLLERTRFGLRLRAVGEHPAMVESAGIRVAPLRYAGVAISGLLCGIGGTYLALALNASFTPNMTAGRGYMALAAMVFAKWHPLGVLAACGLFGLFDALAIRLQTTPLPGGMALPIDLLQALPYVLTLVLLAGLLGEARAPAALGRPYSRGR